MPISAREYTNELIARFNNVRLQIINLQDGLSNKNQQEQYAVLLKIIPLTVELVGIVHEIIQLINAFLIQEHIHHADIDHIRTIHTLAETREEKMNHILDTGVFKDYDPDFINQIIEDPKTVIVKYKNTHGKKDRNTN